MPDFESNELSERELGILKLVATGASNKEIAQKLFISSNTVKVHLRNIFAKIGVASRTEAAMYAVRAGLVETEMAQISSQEVSLLNSDRSDLPVGSSIPEILPSYENVNNKKVYIGYIGLFGLILVILTIIGIFYLTSMRPPAATQIPPTPTALVQWFKLASLPIPRSGLAVSSYENQIFAIGGETTQGISNTVEMYNPQMDTWTELAPKPTPVKDILAGVIGGLIYVPGGLQVNGKPTDITEIYDPKLNQWSQGAPLPKPLAEYGLTVFEGKIYIFGGWDGNKIVDTAYVYDLQNNTWMEIFPMPTARSYPGTVVVGRKIYVIGGWDGQKALTTNEIFMPDSTKIESQWTEGPALPSGRFGMGITNLADIIFIIGGTGLEDDLTMISLSQENKDWRRLNNPLQGGWYFLGAVTVGTRLYAFGGVTEAGFSSQMWSYVAIYTITLPIVR